MSNRALKVVPTEAVRLAQYDNLYSLLFGAPLAVTTERHLQLAGYLDQRQRGLVAKGDPEGVRADLGDRGLPALDEIEVNEAGVARVPTQATFTRGVGPVDSASGLASYAATVKVLQAVAGRADVRGIVWQLDSPGGSAIGAFDAAKAIAAINKDCEIWAAADPLIASGAYYLASQCAQIWLPTDGRVGSIGVYAVREDATAAAAAEGRTFHFITSGERKGDFHEHKAWTPEEHTAAQAYVDQLAAQFFATVKRGRDAAGVALSIEQIAAFEGAALLGRRAVDAKLADRVGTFEEAVAAMTEKFQQQRRPQRAAAHHDNGGTPMADTTQAGTGAGGGAPPAATTETQAVAPPAAATTTTNVTPIRDDAAIAAAATGARDAFAKEQREIAKLCGIAGRKDLYADFAARGLTLDAVSDELAKLRTDEESTTGVRSFLPVGGAATKAAEKPLDIDAIMKRRRDEHEAANARFWGGGRN